MSRVFWLFFVCIAFEVPGDALAQPPVLPRASDVVEEYAENGALLKVCTQLGGLNDGTCDKYNPLTGDKQTIETWLAGVHLSDVDLYPTGETKGTRTYAGNKKTNQATFYISGIKASQIGFNPANGKKHGKTFEYDPSGLLTAETTYNNDVVTQLAEYSPPGVLFAVSLFINGVCATKTWYDPKGNSILIGSCDDNP